MRAFSGLLKPALLAGFLATAVFAAVGQPAVGVVSAPVYVPDTSHSADPMPPGVLAWDQTQKIVAATNGQEYAHFVFYFTNVAAKFDLGHATNISFVTNFTVTTNTGFWSVISGRKYTTVAAVTTNHNVVVVTRLRSGSGQRSRGHCNACVSCAR